MSLDKLKEKIKAHPDYSKVGMVLYHNGVVRLTTREGQEVTGLSLTVDHDKLNQIIAEQKAKPGIVEVIVEIQENRDLNVGDDVMYIAVAGDIRENVIATLTETLNRVKAEVTSKTQFIK
ncbi:MAG: molybdenum cofactor biosynthesis protein MoaE [Desulfamplus sp.]|nr:molybdenum cofactor biosynthesis protein MoaE [Desulfamplus sp.]MBF0259135.1 molybdenum cofactor biosynthesis protein MoaE [Desulfamplus sp.]